MCVGSAMPVATLPVTAHRDSSARFSGNCYFVASSVWHADRLQCRPDV